MRLERRVLIFGVLALAGSAAGAGLGDLALDGPPLLLPSSAATSASTPIVTNLRHGDFLVGWSSGELSAQRFSASHEPIGQVIVLGGNKGESCGTADLAADESGGFWAAWCIWPQQGPSEIRLRRFSAEGVPLTPELEVHPPVEGWASTGAQLETRTDGGVMVLWGEVDLSGPVFDWPVLRARGFEPSGLPVGGTYQVSTLPLTVPFKVELARAPRGGLVATWTAYADKTGEPILIMARLLDEAGAPLTPPVTANTETVSPLAYPKVAVVGSGAFVLAWSAETEARYRVFAWRGTALTPDLAIGGACLRAEFAEGFGSDGALLGCNANAEELKVARLTEDGLGPVVTLAATHANRAAAGLVASGRFVAAWLATTTTSAPILGTSEVRGQGFKLVPLFADGFESGSTDAWSANVP